MVFGTHNTTVYRVVSAGGRPIADQIPFTVNRGESPAAAPNGRRSGSLNTSVSFDTEITLAILRRIAFSSLACAGTGAETGAAVPTPNRATAMGRMLTRMVTGTFLMLRRDFSARARACFPVGGVLFLPTQVPSTAPDLHTSDILTSNAATPRVSR
jgi:hypothetical protein